MERDEPPQDARTALLDAARAELVERGVSRVSLRAVARRADLSHAAPGYVFGDRAGMLTALAAAGFDELAIILESDHTPPSPMRLAALGNAYIAFGLANSALFDLMFSPDALQRQDPDLRQAQERALAPLLQATSPTVGPPLDALTSWALVHGLTTLIRQGALPVAQADVDEVAQDIVHRLASALGCASSAA